MKQETIQRLRELLAGSDPEYWDARAGQFLYQKGDDILAVLEAACEWAKWQAAVTAGVGDSSMSDDDFAAAIEMRVDANNALLALIVKAPEPTKFTVGGN